jgi:hypothetical protein
MAQLPDILHWRPEYDRYNNIPSGTVRVTKDSHFHAIDLICAVSGSTRDYAGRALARLLAGNQLCESDVKYCVRGEKMKIPLVSFTNAIKLMMLLPGKNAKDGRAKFARVLHKYIAGDPDLRAELEKNAQSQHWLNVLARKTLEVERTCNSQAGDASFGPGAPAGEVSMVLASDLSTLLKFPPPSLSDRCSNRRRCHHGRGCTNR